jgi:hypothetical protein
MSMESLCPQPWVLKEPGKLASRAKRAEGSTSLSLVWCRWSYRWRQAKHKVKIEGMGKRRLEGLQLHHCLPSVTCFLRPQWPAPLCCVLTPSQNTFTKAACFLAQHCQYTNHPQGAPSNSLSQEASQTALCSGAICKDHLILGNPLSPKYFSGYTPSALTSRRTPSPSQHSLALVYGWTWARVQIVFWMAWFYVSKYTLELVPLPTGRRISGQACYYFSGTPSAWFVLSSAAHSLTHMHLPHLDLELDGVFQSHLQFPGLFFFFFFIFLLLFICAY